MRRCQDPLHQKLCVIGKETLPLRLIDVPDTIANASAGGVSFIPPRDWNFHVISHTWSRSIRKLSERVGESIGSCDGDPQLYSDAFRGSSFNGYSGYAELISFLEVLEGDGVREVWFDALCINQAAKAQKEKDREILHMGAYYKHSAGCYVVLHGFGEGFDLFRGDEKMGSEDLPRWFSRVWTLQEFLLPRKLTFVVSRPSTVAPKCMFCTYVEQYVASEEGELAAVGKENIDMVSMVESCMAGRSTVEIDVVKEFFRGKAGFLNMLETLAAEHIQPGLANLNVEPAHLSMVAGIITDVLFCTYSHNPDFIRKAKNQQLYFVDREAYDVLAWLRHCPPRIPRTRHSGVGSKPWQGRLFELFTLLDKSVVREKCSICSTYKILDMIQSRSCSHEEDRVLSILSLLGLEGSMHALRSGRALEEQVVKLAEVLAKVNPRLLLEMCVKDVTSSPHKGLSWMPNLGAPDHMKSASRHTERWRMLHAMVELKDVTSKGALRLEGHAVDAHLVVGARGSLKQHFNEANCYTCLKSGALDPRGIRFLVHQMRDCHLEVPQTLSIPLHATAFVETTIEGGITPRGCTIRLDTRWMRLRPEFCPDCDENSAGGLQQMRKISCLHLMPSLDLVLLLWAKVEEGESIMMLCIGTTRLQLHKIGMVRISQEISEAIFSSKPRAEYTLGGFESNDVEQFWSRWGQIQRPIPCNCCQTIIMQARRSLIGICATKKKCSPTYHSKWNDFCPHYIGPVPVEGLSITPSMSRPTPCPSAREEETTLMRQMCLQQRNKYFEYFHYMTEEMLNIMHHFL